MSGLEAEANRLGAINASWARCEREYHLAQDTSRPIMRLQTPEVAPRLEELIERTGGRHGLFKQLAELAMAGRALSGVHRYRWRSGPA